MIYGDIALPQGWAWKRLKYLATYNDQALSENTDDEFEFRYIEISDVSLAGGISNSTVMSFKDAPSRARRVVRRGDTLVSTVRTYLKAIATVEEDAPDLIASTGFCVIRPRNEIDSGYLSWLLKSDVFVDEVVSQSVGVSYPAINAQTLMDIKVPVPPLPIQMQIKAFLDGKIAKIDELSAKMEVPDRHRDAISTLQDRIANYRASTLFHAVLGKIEGLR